MGETSSAVLSEYDRKLQEEWEKKLADAGMPAELPKNGDEVHFSRIAALGKKKRPPDYDPKNDLFVGNNATVAQEDASQCDLRIGLQYLGDNPHEVDKLFRRRPGKKSGN